MTATRETCPVCDAPQAVDADRDPAPLGLDTMVKIFDLCWVALEGGGEHPREPVDWRARALAAERERDEARADRDMFAARANRYAAALAASRVDELVELNPDLDQSYDSFRPAARALVEFLVEELGAHDWPLAVLCPDGADVQDGKPVVDAWAFAVLPFDTTSYIRPDGVFTWLGTSWEPGCECGDGDEPWPEEHRVGCPVGRQGVS